MNTTRILLLLLSLAVACREEDLGNCVVSETVLRNPDEVYSKNVYVHDGLHYTEVRTYRFNKNRNEFDAEPTVVGTFTYIGDRISKARYDYTVAPGNPASYDEYEYSYSGENEILVDEHFIKVVSGNKTTDYVTQLHYVESPENGYYTFENEYNKIIKEYKDGNLVRLGFEDPEGDFEAFGTRWDLQVSYKYDNNPNFAKDYPIGREIFVINFGFNRNNMIEEIYTADNITVSKKHSFDLNSNGLLNKWTFLDNGTNITFEYDCK